MAELVERVMNRTGCTEDEAIDYLDEAGAVILNRRYPFGYPEGTEVEARFQVNQLKIAVYLLNKRGAEGQTSHNENGVSRSYEASDIPESYLDNILPLVEIL